MSLEAPEEDYFVFMPVLACFILVVPFPFAPWIWRMGYFDRDVDPAERRELMAFYRACVQKHLYVHGADKRLLSKNASFAPLVHSLRETFSDARMICCLREPLQTVPSQLSSVRAGLEFFEYDTGAFAEQMLERLVYYYDNLAAAMSAMPAEQGMCVHMGELQTRLRPTVTEAYRRMGLTLDDDFAAALAEEDAAARRFTTGHHYSLDGLGLDGEALRGRFAAAYEHFDFPPVTSGHARACEQEQRAGPGVARTAQGTPTC